MLASTEGYRTGEGSTESGGGGEGGVRERRGHANSSKTVFSLNGTQFRLENPLEHYANKYHIYIISCLLPKPRPVCALECGARAGRGIKCKASCQYASTLERQWSIRTVAFS